MCIIIYELDAYSLVNTDLISSPAVDSETESHHQDDERAVNSDLDAEPVSEDDDINDDRISESSHSNRDNVERDRSPEEVNSRKPGSKENGRNWRRGGASPILSSHGKRHHRKQLLTCGTW